jgi:hypothetical protein
VKAPAPSAQRGYDAGKKIIGRKRHIAVDTDGQMVNLTPADISDSAGAQAILDGIRTRWPWVKHLFADAAYDRLKLMDSASGERPSRRERSERVSGRLPMRSHVERAPKRGATRVAESPFGESRGLRRFGRWVSWSSPVGRLRVGRRLSGVYWRGRARRE